MTLKTAVVAPTPRAIENKAVRVNPGVFASVRKAYRTSCQRLSMFIVLSGPQNFIIRTGSAAFNSGRGCAEDPLNPSYDSVKRWVSSIVQRGLINLLTQCAGRDSTSPTTKPLLKLTGHCAEPEFDRSGVSRKLPPGAG